jgi:hypothetical protein
VSLRYSICLSFYDFHYHFGENGEWGSSAFEIRNLSVRKKEVCIPHGRPWIGSFTVSIDVGEGGGGGRGERLPVRACMTAAPPRTSWPATTMLVTIRK